MALAIFAALIGVPLIEIAVFIEIGGRIGVGWTLALIVATALAGTALFRIQGLATLARARASLDRGELPVQAVLDGVCLIVAGALLLTPGFVTDAVGGLLLVPPVRRVLQVWVLRRLRESGRVTVTASPPPGGRGPIIDGDYAEVDDDEPPADDGEPPRLGDGEPRR